MFMYTISDIFMIEKLVYNKWSCVSTGNLYNFNQLYLKSNIYIMKVVDLP